MVPKPNFPIIAVIGVINEDSKPPDKPAAADFETAISATGHGLFHYLLLLAGLPCCAATLFETSTLSYVLPSADCDLHLTLTDKGILNGVTYAGMIISAIPWGYLSDKLGRRKLLIYGYLLDALCVFMCALSQNVWTLIFFKFLGGFITCGPFAVLMSYLSEFHGTDHRSRVMMVIGMFFSLATISLPALAWFVIPKSWSFQMGSLVSLKSWQIFLAICGFPSFISGIAMIFFPESPKFLMSQGRNEEALRVFQTIFRINTGRSAADYPITDLVRELDTKKDAETAKIDKKAFGAFSFVKNICQSIPLLQETLLKKCVLVLSIQFCALLGLNTVRLWLPQLFSMVSDFESMPPLDDIDSDLCSMLSYSVNKSITNVQSIGTNNTCIPNVVNSTTYVNTIIVGCVGLVGYLIAGALINAVGCKNILIYGLCVSGCCGIGLFWARNSMTTVALSSLYTTIGSISSTALIGIVVNLFPTSLRTMTISLVMMFGRFGALIGNVVFPYLLQTGCLPPFLLIGLVEFACSFLCTLLPKGNESLQ
ncbi:synaptic vesicle glycoprotein 2C [Bradysia coprophila]|uniref:synaptic vesicle glycoprotein 2C n=1 Tax=Bradysia coprophila TaxID=38358 RepID=UPI00187D84F6|nr:synaptic vesicle glycoprotein 2C [Bradysia coprophila]